VSVLLAPQNRHRLIGFFPENTWSGLSASTPPTAFSLLLMSDDALW
jgi:hypothetical protein